jgi:hypothetical protein
LLKILGFELINIPFLKKTAFKEYDVKEEGIGFYFILERSQAIYDAISLLLFGYQKFYSTFVCNT